MRKPCRKKKSGMPFSGGCMACTAGVPAEWPCAECSLAKDPAPRSEPRAQTKTQRWNEDPFVVESWL